MSYAPIIQVILSLHGLTIDGARIILWKNVLDMNIRGSKSMAR
jgi:hypothetical protein